MMDILPLSAISARTRLENYVKHRNFTLNLIGLYTEVVDEKDENDLLSNDDDDKYSNIGRWKNDIQNKAKDSSDHKTGMLNIYYLKNFF